MDWETLNTITFLVIHGRGQISAYIFKILCENIDNLRYVVTNLIDSIYKTPFSKVSSRNTLSMLWEKRKCQMMHETSLN